jgi:ATP-dependent Clp protease protease subunit
MQYIKPSVSTICSGQASSMGSLLLAGGSPGQRFSLPNSKIMLHQPSGGVQGMASDIQIQAQEILRTRSRLNLLYKHHTEQEIEAIEKIMDRDTYMTPEDAKGFGIIDHIITTREGSNKITADLSSIASNVNGAKET